MNPNSEDMLLTLPELETIMAQSGDDPTSRLEGFRQAGAIKIVDGLEVISISDYVGWAEDKLNNLSGKVIGEPIPEDIQQFNNNANEFFRACWNIVPDYFLFAESILNKTKDLKNIEALNALGQFAASFLASFNTIANHQHEADEFAMGMMIANALASIEKGPSTADSHKRIQDVKFSYENGLQVSTEAFCKMYGKGPQELSNWRKYLKMVDAVEYYNSTEYVVVSKVLAFTEEKSTGFESAPCFVLTNKDVDFWLLASKKLFNDLRHYIKLVVESVQSGDTQLSPDEIKIGMEELINYADQAISRLINTYRTCLDVLAFGIYRGIISPAETSEVRASDNQI